MQTGTAKKPPEVSVDARWWWRRWHDYEDFPGHLEAVNAIDIRARVTGFLTKFNFKEGSIVQKGDVLFEIDARPYKAELEPHGGNRAANGGPPGSFRPGGRFFPGPRTWFLAQKKPSARKDYDKIVGDRTEAEGNLKVAGANRETARLRLGWTQVVAPLSGKISRRFIDPGNLVKEDETILTTIVDQDPIYAYFDLDERSTLRFQKLVREKKVAWSMEAKLPVYLGLANEEKDTSGGQQGFPRQGTIHFADNKVDRDTGTWRLRGLFSNKDLSLSPGLFVRVRLPIGEPYEAKLVAEQALGTDQGQKFVYVVDAHNKVSKPHVEVGRSAPWTSEVHHQGG